MRVLLPAVLLFAACGVAPKPDAGGGCSVNACPPTQRCEPLTDTCVPVSSSACPSACGGQTPFCDGTRGVCAACTATEGCAE